MQTGHWRPDVDLTILLIVLFILDYGAVAAFVLAACQGLVTDLLSVAPHGTFIFVYIVVCLAGLMGRPFFNLQEGRGTVVLVMLLVLFKYGVLLGFWTLHAPQVLLSRAFAAQALVSAVLTGLLAVPFYRVFRPLRAAAEVSK